MAENGAPASPFSASQAVIAVVLLQGIEFAAQVIGAPLQQIAQGEDA